MPSFSKGADPFDPNDEPRKTRRPRLQYRHVLARPMAPHLGMPQTRYLIERTRSSGATKHHDDLIDHEDFGDGVIALRERPAYSRASSSTFYEPNIGSGRERPAISRASSSTHIVTIRERPKCLRANSSTLHNQPVAYCRHRLGPQRQGRALDRSGDNSYAIVKSANPNDRDTFWLPSDEDDIIRGRARPPSRPRSLASSFCYSEFDELDDECCVRRELPRSALSGLAMAYDLESRLRHVRQTLMLYVDFNRSTGGECTYSC